MYTVEAILEKKGCAMIKADEGDSVRSVVEQLNTIKVGAAVVLREGEIVGMWTERDFIKHSLDPGFSVDSSTVGEFMSTELKTVDVGQSIFSVMDTFLGLKIIFILTTQPPLQLLKPMPPLLR